MKKIKLLTLATVGIASIGLLAACSSKDNSSSKSTDKVTTVTVATSAASVPYEYSENGKMTGFEYDILKAADKDMKGYKFDFKVYEDSAILAKELMRFSQHLKKILQKSLNLLVKRQKFLLEPTMVICLKAGTKIIQTKK